MTHPHSALETPFESLRTGFDSAQGERNAPPPRNGNAVFRELAQRRE